MQTYPIILGTAGHIDHGKTSLVKALTGIDTDRPVSRQHETEYYNYYGYPYYWSGPYIWGPVAYPAYPPVAPAAPEGTPSAVQREAAEALRQQDDIHLRSTHEVTNYYIEATDGDIGHVEDFLIDDEIYEPGVINRTLILGNIDEWTLTSKSGSHPYHIHVNPFQVIAVLDPNGKDVSGPDAVDVLKQTGDLAQAGMSALEQISEPAVPSR
mgnify:CR=1 FL=1